MKSRGPQCKRKSVSKKNTLLMTFTAIILADLINPNQATSFQTENLQNIASNPNTKEALQTILNNENINEPILVALTEAINTEAQSLEIDSVALEDVRTSLESIDTEKIQTVLRNAFDESDFSDLSEYDLNTPEENPAQAVADGDSPPPSENAAETTNAEQTSGEGTQNADGANDAENSSAANADEEESGSGAGAVLALLLAGGLAAGLGSGGGGDGGETSSAPPASPPPAPPEVPPLITSDGGGDTALSSVNENTTFVTDVDATDENGDIEGAGLTHSISGGEDSALFSIDPDTGELNFLSAPDFENPNDVGTDNTYEVEVTVTDSSNLTDTQNISITIIDENISPNITSLSPDVSPIELSDLNGATGPVISPAPPPELSGMIINGETSNDYSGVSMSLIGDINNDGYSDLLIGAVNGDGNNLESGKAYVVFGTSNIPDVLELSDLNGSNGFAINGKNNFDQLGYAIAAGDVNGDGFDDIIVGAPELNAFSGETYVIFGGTSFTSSFDVSDLNGTNGFTLIGPADSATGRAIDSGDFNGDGLTDAIISAPFLNTTTGASYIIFGSTNGFSATIDASSLSAPDGLTINGIDTADLSGVSTANAGDFNNDGIDDFIIGAGTASSNASYSGEAYIIFGSSSLSNLTTLNLSDLNGTNGFVLNGIDTGDFAGSQVSSAGDINGDGIKDVMISAVFANNTAGQTYIVFGSSLVGSSGAFELSSLNGNNGFFINGINPLDSSGGIVSNIGDVNGDGLDDVLISAASADPNGLNGAGQSYIIFGSTGGFSKTIELSAVDGNTGLIINGIESGDSSGRGLSGGGDFNNDGISDFAIGAPLADPNGSYSGESYILFGNPFLSKINVQEK